MFVYSVKAQNLKLFLTLISSVLVIVSVVLLAPVKSTAVRDEQALPVMNVPSQGNFKNVVTGEDRVAFLKGYGWEVEPEPLSVVEVMIPGEFDALYENYDQMQNAEGLDLKKYRGKTVRQYTYLVNNYDYDGSVYAHLLIYKDAVIGGDVSSAREDGFIHGFTKENQMDR